MKRYRPLAVAVCTGLLVLAGVGASTTQGKTAAPAATQASGTITLAGWASSPTETKLLREVIRGFEKTFPSIKVDYAPISGDYPAAMLAKFAARNSAGRVLRRLERGARLDQAARTRSRSTPSSRPNKLKTKAFFPSLLNGFKGPDKTLRLPEGLVAARDADEQRGCSRSSNVTAPTNWAELSAAAQEAEGSRRPADLPDRRPGAHAGVHLPERRRVPERDEDEGDGQLAGCHRRP